MWKQRCVWPEVLVLVAACAAHGEEPGVTLCEPWQAEYAGDDATGGAVIGLWSFNEPAERGKVPDASGHGHAATLAGATHACRGPFRVVSGDRLRLAGGRQAAPGAGRRTIPRSRPAGAFTIEMWLRPKPELAGDYPEAFLLDKKYVAHDDYQLILSAPASGRHAGAAGLSGLRPGLGHVVLAADATRAGRVAPRGLHLRRRGHRQLLLRRRARGEQRIAGRGAIKPGKHGLSIGDRIGSYYHGFPGFLDQVRCPTACASSAGSSWSCVSDRPASCAWNRRPAAVLGDESPARSRSTQADADDRHSAGLADADVSTLAELAAGAQRPRSSIRWTRACGRTSTSSSPTWM